MRIGEAGLRQRWREFPGIGDIVRFEPGLNGLLALDAGKLVFELRGLQVGANLLFALSQEAAVFGADLRAACGFAQPCQTIAQRRGGTARGRGRIIELVGETGREFAEGGELLMLLLRARNAADAVREQTHEAAGKFRHSAEKFRELADGKCKEM